jgi:hypothetical protein
VTNTRSISVGGHALGGLRALAIFAVIWVGGLLAPALVLWAFQGTTPRGYWHPWPAMVAMGVWWCVVMLLLAGGIIWGREHLTLTKPKRVALGLVVAITGLATVVYYNELADVSTAGWFGLLVLLGTGAVLIGGVVDLSLGPWEKRYDIRHVTP